MKKIISVMVIFSLLFTLCFSSFAQEDIKSQERRKIEKIIIKSKLQARKFAKNQLKSKKLKEENISRIYKTEEFKTLYYSYLDNLLDKYNIKRIDSRNNKQQTNTVSTMSVVSPPQDEVLIEDPEIYISSQGYVIMASAYWIDKGWQYHVPFGYGTLDVGGADGLGIYFDNPTNIHIADHSFYTYDENLNSYNTNLYAYRKDSSGVFYKAQDQVTNTTLNPYHNYTFDSAHISVWPVFSGPVDSYAHTHWVHTWDETDIENVIITDTGFAVTFTKTNNAWDGVSDGYAHIQY